MSGFCGQCGTPKASAEQKFCQECGAPSAPAALVAPVAPAAAVPPPEPHAPVAGDYAVPAALPPREGGGSFGRVLGVGALVLALGAGGFVAWQVLGSSGGASSPEEAVRQFIEASADQDVVAALELVNPGEVEGFDSLYEAARERAEDQGLVGGESITDALEVTIQNIELDVDEQGDYSAFVTLDSADYKVTYDPDELPDRLDFVRDQFPDAKEWSGDVWELLENDGYDPEYSPEVGLSTIKIDGKWYVTALGTAIDINLRQISRWEGEDYVPSPSEYDAIDDEVDPIVGDDPEEALKNVVEAASDQDGAELLANFPVDQFRALRPYVGELEDLLADEGITVDGDIAELDLSTEDLSDGLVKVVIENAYGSGTASDGDETLSGEGSIDGRCFEGSSYEDDYYDDGRVCIDSEVTDYTGIDEVYVVMRKVDGGYQLDPLATAVEYAKQTVESLPDEAIEDALFEICYEVSDYEEAGC